MATRGSGYRSLAYREHVIECLLDMGQLTIEDMMKVTGYTRSICLKGLREYMQYGTIAETSRGRWTYRAGIPCKGLSGAASFLAASQLVVETIDGL